ncbi:MAG: hypothetical protein J7623_01800 [Chitinophaga sp.]|uniref:hypothetical protein n=1 Tax=Chitinophaga sp. TaxID=1869181 RepID=UPI001B24FFDF|nr:hypothetical protein [Chitinophaga sp.]MBO9727350.1 hypothetical protein [Chitinophaga sp.]
MKRLFVMLCMQVGLVVTCLAQVPQDGLKTKNISDTFLLPTRSLLLKGPFNPQTALQQLFPGKHYRLTDGKYVNEMINWECKTAKRKQYEDVNEDGLGGFPYENGVATRLLDAMDFKDSSGMQYKVISFNHSEFDADGAQVSRFTGGLLGLAKFVLTDQGWNLRMFTPAIKAYGAFSNCPTPKSLQIGVDQYAFILKSSNGPAGGPYYGSYFMIAGINGAYQQVMAAYAVELTGGEEDGVVPCTWTSTYSVPASDKKYFRDILVTTTGTASASDMDHVPKGVEAFLKGKKSVKFVEERRFVYKGPAKGYEEQLPAKVSQAK